MLLTLWLSTSSLTEMILCFAVCSHTMWECEKWLPVTSPLQQFYQRQSILIIWSLRRAINRHKERKRNMTDNKNLWQTAAKRWWEEGKRKGEERKGHRGREEILTSYPATRSGLLTLFCIIALQMTHRGMTIPNKSTTFFSHILGRIGGDRLTSFLL